MKRHFALLLLFVGIVFAPAAHGQGNLVWAKGMGGASSDFGTANAIDNVGNVVLVGMFQGTIDADPGAGVFNLTSAGSNDVFIIKLDYLGNFVWAGRIGGTLDDYAIRVTTDASRNIFVVGRFSGTADFDPSVATANLTSGGCEDAYLFKLNESGAYQWARRVGAGGCDEARGVVVDAAGNVYYSGNFTGTVDFDPGPGVVTKVCVATATDAFISKFDAAGNHVWTSHFDGTALSTSYAHNLAIDAAGDIYTASFWYNNVDFDPTAGVSSLSSTAGNYDVAIVKLSGSTGNLMLLRSYGGTPAEYNWGVAVDAAGNIYTSGYHDPGTVDFDPGVGVFNITATGADGYICKVDAAGNFLWARTFRSPGNFTNCNAIKLDNSGNPVMVGYFNGTTDFDPGAGTFNLSASAGQHDVFLVKLSAAGNFLCATRQGGSGTDFGMGLSIDLFDNVWNVGQFNGTADFDPTAGTFNLVSAGAGDIFASVVTTCVTALPVKLSAFEAMPQGNEVLVSWRTDEPLEGAWFEVERSADAEFWHAQGQVDGDAAKHGRQFEWLDNKPLEGLSYYRLVRHQQGQTDISEITAVMMKGTGEILLWPNPATSELWVNAPEASQVTVLNLQGAAVLSQSLEMGDTRLEVSGLPPGYYLARFEGAMGNRSLPFVVER
jgi:hypothetical protein